MRFSRGAVLFVLLVVTVVVAAEAPTVPGRFDFKWVSTPIWISAGEAVNADGSVREGIDEFDRSELHRRREMLLEQRRDMSTEGISDCDVEFVGYVAQGGEPDVDTFARLREIAAERRVITGTVAASAVGLHHGMPHTVLRIESESSDTIHVIYPRGRIRLEKMTVCNADPMYAELPVVGDAITVIVSKPLDNSGTLYWPAGSSILYEHEGVLVVAPFLRDDPALHRFKSLNGLTAALRKERISAPVRQ